MRALFTAAAAAVALCASASAQGGPDAFGHVWNPIPNNFLDISATGTDDTPAIAAGGDLDDGGIVILVGFSFSLYGTAPGAPGPTTIGFSTNGYLADSTDLVDFTNDCPIASPIDPDRGIYPFWDDCRLTEHGQMFHQVLGTTPNQRFIAQWEDVGTFDDSTASLTFQAHLLETDPVSGQDNVIEFHYGDMIDGTSTMLGFDASGGGATIGIEDTTGLATALTISCNVTGTIAPMGGAGGTDGFSITRSLPSIFTPTTVFPGDMVTVDGFAAPGALYVTGFSTNTTSFTFASGPAAGLTLLIGPAPLTIIGVGLADGTTGAYSSLPQAVPLMGADCVQAHFQTFTFTGFGPLSGGAATGLATTTIFPVSAPTGNPGSLVTVGNHDRFEFMGTAGEVVEITLCRDVGQNLLDPFVCLEAPSGAIEASNDDSGDTQCTVLVPGSAVGNGSNSFIAPHTLLETGMYTIRATAFQGQGNELGTYTVYLQGCSGTLSAGMTDQVGACN